MSCYSVYLQPSNYQSVAILQNQTQFVQTRSVENGRVVFKSDFKSVNPAIADKDFDSSDFSIASLTSCGAVSQLKEVSFSGDCKVDDLVNQVSQLKASISHE